MMNGKAVTALIAAALAAFPAAAEGSAWEFFGSERVSASFALADGREAGFSAETRLGIEFDPESGPGFRAEGSIRHRYGGESPEALAYDAALAPVPSEGSLPPDLDLHRSVSLDQAYASFPLGPLDARFGLVTVAWGSGYAFNPTARVLEPAFPGAGDGAPRGRLGASAALSFLGFLSLEGYALAEPRLRSKVPEADELDAGTFPFALRAMARTDFADVSLCFGRSLLARGAEPGYFAGLEAAGFLGPVTLYLEAAAAVLAKAGGAYRAFDPAGDIDACAGLSYLVPAVEATLRLESAWLGSGLDDPAGYDRFAVIRGERSTLGRSYLFAMLDKEVDDRFAASAGGLWNLYDGSGAVSGRAAWSPIPSLELSMEGAWFFGSGDSEFGGEIRTGPAASLDPFVPAVAVAAKASF